MKTQRQRGQAIVEYIIIFPILLLLMLGALQFALIYQAKFTLNYAAFMGARQGALKNASMNSIKDGVAAGMAPLFMRTGGAPFLDDLAKARIISAIEIFNPLTAKVEIISPTQAAFDALKQGSELPNDNLMYRSGDGDGMSIQDANLLKIKVTYCVKLVVPFVNRMIYFMVNGIAGVERMTHEFFGGLDPTKALPTTPNMCTNLSAQLRQKVDSYTDPLPAGIGGAVSTAANNMIDKLPSSFTIPGLNWDILGMRIPITAEAIVRMQSPMQATTLP